MYVPRYKKLKDAVKEIKRKDKRINSYFSSLQMYHLLRTKVISNVRIRNDYYINMDELYKLFTEEEN